MNQLTTNVQMTSLDVAELTGKEHRNVMRDIRNEMNELGAEVSLLIFEQSIYTNERGREYECYSFGKDGAMQLALKYDATTRYKVIKRIEELENNNKPAITPVLTEPKEAVQLLDLLDKYKHLFNEESNTAIQSHVVRLLTSDDELPKVAAAPVVVEKKERRWYSTRDVARIANVTPQKVAWISKKYEVKMNPSYCNFTFEGNERAPILYNETGKQWLIILVKKEE